MDVQSLILFLLIGLAAGWLASRVMSGGLGLLGDLIVGVIGSLIGGTLFGLLGIFTSGGVLGSLITAFAGAVVLLFALRLIKKGAPA